MPRAAAVLTGAAVKSFISRLLILVCALHLSGAHWAALQTVAWARMLVTRVGTEGLGGAIQSTFDGDHPCPMCSAISDGQKQEKEKSTESPALKVVRELQVLIAEAAALPQPAQVGEMRWTQFAATAPRRMEAPPVPPPLA